MNGVLECIHGGAIHGWALCISEPKQVPEIEIVTGEGEIVATGTPTIIRPDLENRLAGFRITLPSNIFARKGCSLSARFKGTSSRLNGEPLSVGIADRYLINCDGFFEKNLLTGWAIDLAAPNAVLEANLILGGEVIAASKCNGAIDEIKSSGRFHLKLPDRLFAGRIYEFRIELEGVSGVIKQIKCFLPKEGSPDLKMFPFLAWPECERFPGALRQKAIWEGYFEKSRKLRKSRREMLALTPYSNPGHKILSAAIKDELKNGNPADAVALAKLNAILNSDEADAHSQYAKALVDTGKTGESLQYIRSLSPAMRRQEKVLAVQRKIHSFGKRKRVRKIAFYLPQFHPVEENNRYWGKGFTEWDNVNRATPYYHGQVQPRRPIGLGYYDLRLPEVANEQFKLARAAGIDGFCYYYYWFNGKKIMDTPLNNHFNGKTDPFPFCLCWANENWTRQWDGGEDEILLRQVHTEESDREFIRDIAPYLAHEDYIRYEGKPVILVYRVNKIDNPETTAHAWRTYCRDVGIGEIFLCAVHSFSFEDPRTIGFDAAVDFPPMANWRKYGVSYFYGPPSVPPQMLPNVPAHELEIVDYERFRKAFMDRPSPPYLHFRSSMLAWDNTPRKKSKGAIHHGFTPAAHQSWLWSNMEKGMADNGETLVFINAWNEWSEGCILEPDSHWGYANLGHIEKLKAIAALAPYGAHWRNGLPDIDGGLPYKHETIVLVSPPDTEASFLLEFARALHLQCGNEVIFIFDETVPLKEAFGRLGDTFCISKGDQNAREKHIADIVKRIGARGINKVLSFGPGASWMLPIFSKAGFRIVQLFPDELPGKLPAAGQLQYLNKISRALVFFSRIQALEYARLALPPLDKLYLLRGSISRDNLPKPQISGDAIPTALTIYGKSSSQMDLFLAVAQAAQAVIPNLEIIVNADKTNDRELVNKIKAAQLGSLVRAKSGVKMERPRDGSPVIFLETGAGTQARLNLIEAMANGIPIAFFESEDFADLDSTLGCSAKYPDIPALVSNLSDFASDPQRFAAASMNALAYSEGSGSMKAIASSALSFFSELGDTLHQSRVFSPLPPTGFRKISVIIPNYNYARYLELRLESVFLQTLRPMEIIILDDGSTDGSQEIIERMMADTKIPCKYVPTEGEAAGTFAQWAKGIEMAEGDIIWIAEADDYCEPTFLAEVSAKFNYPEVCIAWADSISVDKDGNRIQEYKDVYRDMYEGATYDYDLLVDGATLLNKALYYFNLLPNASAVLFRKDAIKDELSAIKSFKACGDWWLWSSLCIKGKAAYVSKPLNYHRIHHSSVVSTLKKEKLIAAIIENIGIFAGFAKRPELKPDGLAVLEIFRRVELMYNGNRQFLETDIVWCKNHPAFQQAYKMLEEQFNPRQYLKGTSPIQLVLTLAEADPHLSDLVSFLSHYYALSIIILGEKTRLHPAYEIFRKVNSRVRFIDTLDKLHPDGRVQLYGLNILIAAAQTRLDYPYEIILDSSFDRLPDALDSTSEDVDMDDLVEFMRNASEIFFIGEKLPESARPFLAGAMTLASRLKIEKSTELKDAFQPETAFEEEVYFYESPLEKAIMINAYSDQ